MKSSPYFKFLTRCSQKAGAAGLKATNTNYFNMKKKTLKEIQNEVQKHLLSKVEEKQVKGGFIVIDDIAGN